MHHLIAAVAVAAMAVSPALAQDGRFEAVQDARQTFTKNLDNEGLFNGAYYDLLTEGLSGAWASVSVLFTNGGPDAAEFNTTVATACETYPVQIAVVSPLGLTVTTGRNERISTVSYTYQGGTGFSAQVDARAFLERMSMLEQPNMRQSSILMLGNINADVSIFRPHADVLVLTRLRGVPEIYARCAAQAAVPQPEPGTGDLPAGLVEALGVAFDAQFPPGTDAAVRDEFIACAAEVFRNLSAADLGIVIQHSFNPPPEERERIEAAYPQLASGAIACAEAADDRMDAE